MYDEEQEENKKKTKRSYFRGRTKYKKNESQRTRTAEQNKILSSAQVYYVVYQTKSELTM